MKNVDIFVANRIKIIENLTASKSEIIHQNFVLAGGKFIETLLRIRSYSTSAFTEFVTRNLVQSIVLYYQWSAVSMNFQRSRCT